MSESGTTQVPVDAVGADQLPREKAWQFDDMAKIVGRLYLESRHEVDILNDQFEAVMTQMQERLQNAIQENTMLKQELEKYAGLQQGSDAQPDNDGSDKVRGF